MINAAPFEVTVERRDDEARLRLVGELDIATAAQLENAVSDVLARGARRVIVDFAELTFIDSSGLRMCIVLHDRAKKEGWTLALTRAAAQPMAVFRITGAEENLPFVEEPSPS